MANGDRLEEGQDYLAKGHVDAELLVRSVRYAIERNRLELGLARALEQLDRQFQIIADVQASLLPSEVPRLPGFDILPRCRACRASTLPPTIARHNAQAATTSISFLFPTAGSASWLPK